ncbi:MAG: hypothetical protein U0R19_05405 [Bryobacteraceae bacterium]
MLPSENPPNYAPTAALAAVTLEEVRALRGIVFEIARSIPLQRRPLAEATRNLHVAAIFGTRVLVWTGWTGEKG